MNKKYFSDDNFYYPATNIPINELNIRNKEKLDELELRAYENLYNKKLLYDTQTITIKYIKELHKIFLGKIYRWAGKIRKVKIAKDSISFCFPQFIDERLEEFEKKYVNILSKNFNKEELAWEIAEFKSEFLIIHPFRDGNGRLIRFITDLIAYHYEYDLIWANYDFNIRNKERYFKAMEKAMLEKNYMLIKRIIFNNLKSQNKK